MKTVKTFGKIGRILKPLAVLFTAGILITLFYSCEIGLGAAVDTQPPKIEIQNPPVDAVIRDNFALGGTFDDDGSIKSVRAVLTRIGGDEKFEITDFNLTKDANEKGAGTWTIPVDTLDSQGKKLISDGSYQASITIKDNAGRETIQNTTFTVDNTPPVIVLQRPGTNLNASLADSDTYGQVFTLEGLGADDNNIDHIDVMVYADKEKTIPLHSITLSNVPPTINMTVAEYGDDAYTAIYGNVAPSDFVPAQFYCSIMAYDSAKRYSADGITNPGDENGNSTDVYYIYEDISKDVLKSTKITEVYHILSGTFNSSRSASDTNAIISKLAQNEQKTGSFVLDPKNNPTFSVAGKPTLLKGENAECLKDATDFTVPNDSDITIQVNVGLDNSPIVNDNTFKVYFQKAKFENGKYIADPSGSKIYPAINEETGKKKIGSNYQFTVNVKSSADGLEVEHAYLIGVDGKDENDQPILAANNGYGFYLISTASAPTLKDIVPSENTIYVKAGDSLTISGKTTLTEGKPVVSIRYNDVQWVTTPELSTPVAGSTNEYAFELTIPAGIFTANNGGTSKEFSLEIRAANGTKTTSTYKTVMYDIDLPLVNELTVSPEITDSVNHSGKYILNGEVTIKALLEDDFTAVKDWHYEVVQEGKTIPNGPVTTSSKVDFSFDTTQLTDKKDAQIKIVVHDKAGNEQTYPINCYIDQATDKPAFEAQDGLSWYTGIVNPYYMKQNAKNVISGSLYSKITDDDSVAFVKFEVKAITPYADDKDGFTVTQKANPAYEAYTIDVDQSSINDEIKSAIYEKTGKESSVTHLMPSKSGFYLVTQTVYDKNFVKTGTQPAASDEEKTVNANYFTKQNYVIKISGVGPQYSLIQDTSYISPSKTDKDLNVTVSIEDGEAPYKIWRKDELIAENVTASSYTDTFKVSEIISDSNIIAVGYKVQDINGVTQKEIKYAKDSQLPTFKNPKIEPDTDDYSVYKVKEGGVDYYYLNNKEQKFTISGLAEDNTSVDKVYLTVENTGGTGTKIEKNNENGYFSDIQFADFKANGTVNTYWTGAATVKIKVVDIAGNESTETSLNIKFDCEAPEPEHQIDDSSKDLDVRIGDYANDRGDEDVGGKYSYGTYGSALTITLRGYFPDNEGGSGVNKFYYKVFKKEVKIDSGKNDNTVVGEDVYFNTPDSLKAWVIAKKDDTFSPITEESRDVEYNIKPTGTPASSENTNGRFGGNPVNGYTVNGKGYVQFRTSVDTNYKTTLKGFQEGKNYLVLVAEDNVGNTRLDYVEDLPTPENPAVTKDYYCYSLNVDITAPTIPDKAESRFTNLIATDTTQETVEISGTVSDKYKTDPHGSSGIKEIEFTSDQNDASIKIKGNDLTTTGLTPEQLAGDPTLKRWNVDVRPLLSREGTANISAKVTDEAGFSISDLVANISVDRTGPVVTINSPAVDAVVGKTFTISGTANDGSGAGLSTKDTDKVILYYTKKANPAKPTTDTISTNSSEAATKWIKLAEKATSSEWNFTNQDLSGVAPDDANTPVYFTVAVKDASGSGNTGYATPRRLVVDRKKPKFESGTVGGKTDTSAWFNTRTLNIAGSFTDPATGTGQNAVNGSSVNYVYYLIGNNENDKVALPTTDSTYNTNITITGNSSTASLSIWASDAAGNESTRKTYTLQIDADEPEVVEYVTAQQKAGYFNNSTLTDGQSQKTFTFLVQDKAGGSTVKTSDASALEVKVGRYDLTTSGTDASSITIEQQSNSDGKENYLVTLVIGKTDLARLSGNSSILVTVTDVAGNKSPATSIGSLNVDKTAPTVTIKDPDDKGTADGIQINGTFTLEGNARDNNALQVDTGSAKSLKLYYTTKAQTTGITTYANSSPVPTSITVGGISDAATKWVELASAANAADWSFSINTSTISTGKQTVHFLVETKDEAGNTGYSNPKTLEIDQDTDRPVITFSNLELGTTMSSSTANNYEGYVWLKNTTKIIGTVSDDDGVQSMQISLDGSDWKDVTLTGSAFSYDLKNFYTTESTDVKKEAAANGPKVLYFKVTDKASSSDTRVFTSATTSSNSAVKISDGTNEYGNSTKQDSLLYVKVDTMYPQVILKGAKLASDQNFTNAYNTIRLGGDKKSFVVKLAASDAMGINAVSGTAACVYDTETLSLTGGVSGPVTEDGEAVYTLTFTLTDANVATLSGYAGAVNIRVVAKDNAGNETPQTASIAYDFAPSLVSSWNPSSSVTNSGNVTAYGILTENAKVWYSISPSRTVGPNESVTSWTDGEGTATPMTAKTVQDWQELPGNSNTWTVNFDNGSSDASHEKSLNMYLIDYGIANRKAGALATSDDIESSFNKFVKLYLWIKTEDDAGNIKEDSVHELLVDPQGDKPSIGFSYPAENGKTLGNEVSIYGTAQDLKGTNIGVDSVWVQIKSTTHGSDTTTNYGTAPSYNESTEVLTMTLTSADLDYMANNGYNVYKMSDYVVGGQSNTTWTVGGTTDNPAEWAALASSSGASWNISINIDAHKELNPPEGTNSNAVGIRVFARDGDGKLSLKADRYVIFDADNPIIKDLYLVQSTDGKLATASTASRQYTPDMFVKGKWYLTGTVTDNMGISELVINGETLIITKDGTASIANGTTIKGTEANPKNWTECVSIASSGGGETVTFKYPLATDTADSFDNLSFRIVAKDKVSSGNPHEKEEPISINYDNKSPEIATTEEAGKNISADVQQRNSWYSFSSKVTEASQDNKTQSGFAYTAFYFTRNDTVNSKNYLYDVLKDRNEAAVDLTGITPATTFGSEATTENTLVKVNDIYWYRKNITRQASLNTFTVSDPTGIRKNALVNIDGAMYLITGVNGTSVTIDGYPKQDVTVAYVAIAGIVDNTIPEGDGTAIQPDGYYEKPSRDDGDRMIESVDKSGTSWTWQAQICSRNISDGPIILHYVVFDKAGNKTYESVAGTVSNNRPRIAGATFATDYNGDGDTEDDGESFVNYSIAKSYTDYWTGGTESAPVFDPDKTVKNSNAKNPLPTSQTFGAADEPIAVLRGKTVITPEIVGGNGKIYYSYKINNDNNKKGQNATQIIDNGSLDYTAKTGDITIQLGDLLSWNDTTNASTAWPFEFTFWDSTEGTTKFVNSQSATLTMFFAIQAKTVSNPWVKINPFYWNGLKDNSIEDSATASKVTDLKGHIELEADWANTSAYKSTATSGLYDGDPKVSGKIVITGTAHDDSRINTLKANIFGTEKTVATFTANNELESSFAKTAFDTNHLWFNITNQTIDKTGHTVEWELHIDTATILTAVADTDKTVTVTATNFGLPSVAESNAADALVGVNGSTKWAKTPTYTGAKSNSPGTTQTTSETKTDYYKMDVVPYITKISTTVRSASGLKDNNIRSASGKYSILANNASNTITVSGFNFATGNGKLVAKIANTETSGGTTITSTSGGTAVTIAATNTTTATITNSGIEKSGYLELFSNTVRALNNINGNDAYGTAKNSSGEQLSGTNAVVTDYEKAYNREPDYYTTKNVQLTDDRYLRFFDMKQTNVTNGYYPNMIMEGDDPVFGYIDNNGGGANVTGAPASTAFFQRAKFNGSTGAQIYKEYLGKSLASDQMAMARDQGGRYYQVSVSNYNGDYMSLYYDRFAQLHDNNVWNGMTGYSSFSGTSAITGNNNVIVLDAVANATGRFQYPKIIATGNSLTSTANVYLAYFDSDTGKIYLRDFMIGKRQANSTYYTVYNNYNNITFTYSTTIDGNNSGFEGPNNAIDYTNNGTRYVKINGNYYQLTRQRYGPTGNRRYYYTINGYTGSDIFTSNVYNQNTGTHLSGNESANEYQLYSGGVDNNNNAYEQYINIAEGTGNMGYQNYQEPNATKHTVIDAGNKYYDMGISNGHIVIIYYDDNSSRLKLRYSKYEENGANPSAEIEWVDSTIVFPEYVGSYVSLDVDNNGGIHISALDVTDSDLSYIYLSSYNAQNCTHITVDQFGSVGNWTEIKVNSTGIPYIAYCNATEYGQRDALRLAYPKNITNSLEQGIETSSRYTTGKWEYMTVPSITPAQGGDSKFQQVCLDFDSAGTPVVGYLGTKLEFGKWFGE